MNITLGLAKKLIAIQFSEYADLTVTEAQQQGHDNRTYRIGDTCAYPHANSRKLCFKLSFSRASSICHSRVSGNPEQCKRYRK